jgi:hypothetical protein
MLTRALFAFVLITGLAAMLGFGPQPLAGEESASGQTDVKVLALGITDHEVTAEELEKGATPPAPRFNTPALAYVLAANLRKSDMVQLRLWNEDKAVVRNEETLESDKAKYLLLAGKRGVPPGGWPDGTYHAELTITRDGKPLIKQSTKPISFEQ